MAIEAELNQLINPKTSKLKGSLGITNNVVSVSSRPSFVWVRLLDNPNELIKAHNYKVSPTYNLPVLLEFDGYKYEITGIDTDRYANWGTDYPFLPNHGRQHSALRGDEGNDIVWVDSQQFLPLLSSPENNKTTGSNGIYISSYSYLNSNDVWTFAGGTGMFGFSPLNASGSNLYLLMLRDSDGGFYSLTGTTIFSSSLSGTSDVLSYLPTIPENSLDRPLAAIKATTGEQIGWRSIYDLRQLVGGSKKPAVTSLTGDVISVSGSWELITEIVPEAVTNAKRAKMPSKTISGNMSGVSAVPSDLTTADLASAGFGILGAVSELVNEVPDGSLTHFTFDTPAYLIWVEIDGKKELESSVTFVSGSTEFDLSFAPQTGSNVVVTRLAPAVEPAITNDYVLVREEQDAGTNAGTFTAGSWQIRVINTEVRDASNICSLPTGSNIIRLNAGTYRYKISAPAYSVGFHRVRLYDVTEDAMVIGGDGTSEYCSIGHSQNRSFAQGEFTIAAQNDFRIEHRCEVTQATNGLGVSSTTTDFGTEIYTIAEFWKVG